MEIFKPGAVAKECNCMPSGRNQTCGPVNAIPVQRSKLYICGWKF